MSAIITADKTIRKITVATPRLDRVTEDDVKNHPEKVARLLNAQSDAIYALYKKAPLDYVEFEDVVIAVRSTISLRHAFNQAVRWWVVTSSVANPQLSYDATTDLNTLVLTTNTAATVTIRIVPRGA